ncbi:MAG: cyclic nucleotide-binding/CBS domain-containing protein [Gammaproteobacteria bacterium]|nr:cyclic nucleotide-binding/CBS domain-containing protein [Gammaproteobacteria bacterium]
MEIELVEIRDFIAEQHPFNLLTIDQLNEITLKLEVRYMRRGQSFPPKNNKKSCLYIMRSGAVELRDADNKLTGKLGEGDIYTAECQFMDFSGSSSHLVLEDSFIYQLPCDDLKSLCEQAEDFRYHFEADLNERLQKAARYNSHDGDVGLASMTIGISEILKKEPITLDLNSTIQEAASVMSEHKVSSIMLTEEDKLSGIVTDRDIRSRCVAKAMDVSLPVSEIMSREIITMRSDDLVLHALMTMTKAHVNHIPVVDDGRIVGMLTASDLTSHSSANPAFMTSQIRKSKNMDELRKILQRLPAMQQTLSSSGVTARHIGETISCITDALTIRLIEIAQKEMGPEPVPYVWVSGGSQARHEQSSHSDQDNALIISDRVTDKDMPYFTELAKRVCDALDACGFVHCPGDAMAMNEKWCQPYSVWKKYFWNWIETPEPMALMLSSIFFDLRAVYGDVSLHKKLQDDMLKRTAKNSLFIAHMVTNALTHKPPLGFFRTFVLIHDGEHDNTFDIKHRGIVPITDIARVLALAEGINKVNTTERIEALGGTGSMSREMSMNLIDALEFIANLRIKHQAKQIRSNQPADNYMPPDDLSSLERKHLKDAFSIIKDAQESLEKRYSM